MCVAFDQNDVSPIFIFHVCMSFFDFPNNSPFPFAQYCIITVITQAAWLLKGGGCGGVASPPHHIPQFPRMLSSYY